MKGTLLLIVLWLCIFVDTAYSLNCYTCSSSISNCISKHTDCNDDDDMCYKKVSGIGVAKKCTSLDVCKEDGNKCKNSSCEVYCCHEDYCNNTRSLQGSHLYILVPIVIYLFVSCFSRDQ